MPTLTTCRARIADTSDVFSAIHNEDCNLAVWQRHAVTDFSPLVSGDPLDLRLETGLSDLPQRLRTALVGNRFGAAALHPALIADVAMLARHFCLALGLAQFELRLEVVRTDSCRKFHADFVSARLITTYVGKGTDWLEDADVTRVAAGHQPHRINRLNPFDVGLFKGKLATDRPAIHRSPPIEDSAAARLLLVLNPARKLFVDPENSVFPPGGEVA